MLNRILNNGYLGTLSQARALSTVSNNIANSQTIGFKSSVAEFHDIMPKDRSGNAQIGAGVRSSEKLLADQQGALSLTDQPTNVAISGKGFFFVQELDPSTGGTLTGAAPHELTRAGDFKVDAFGHLVNSSGRALMGASAEKYEKSNYVGLKPDDLELVSVAGLSQYGEPTKNIYISAKLPRDAAVGSPDSPEGVCEFSADIIDKGEGRDAAGEPISRVGRASFRIIKTAVDDSTGEATWSLYNNGATYLDDGSAITGGDRTRPIGTFKTSKAGALIGAGPDTGVAVPLDLGPDFAPVTITFSRSGSGMETSAVAGKTFQMVSQSADGIARRSLKEVGITSDSYVEASFDGGQSRKLFKIVNGLVANPSGLESVSGSNFRETQASGMASVNRFDPSPRRPSDQKPGEKDPFYDMFAGSSLVTGSVEQSTSDLGGQFTTLIGAQRAYSASAKLITSADEMTKAALELAA